MTLPKVFAIYRTTTETFLLLQTDENEHGEISRLKPWFTPNIKEIPSMPKEQREQHASWLTGNEWYVEPAEVVAEEIKLENVEIHKQTYNWCYTGYRLVWSNYAVHSRRNTLGAPVWGNSPTIPILEFSSKQIYPRAYSPFYPRWVSVKTKELADACSKARALFVENEDELVYKNLRIRTPKPGDSDEDTDSDDSLTPRSGRYIDDDLRESAGAHFLPVLLLFILLGSVVGLYGLIGHIAYIA